MLRVSFQGLRKAMYFPSGEIWAAAISGLPKNSSRSRMGGSPAAGLVAAGAACASDARRLAARTAHPATGRSKRTSWLISGPLSKVDGKQTGALTHYEPAPPEVRPLAQAPALSRRGA